MTDKIITVFGGLGVQGGSLVKALLKRNKYHIRVSTRNAHDEKAQEATLVGCEVVQATYEDLDSLRAAVKGAYGCWFITYYWVVKSEEKEVEFGRNVGLACKEAGVKHVVFSSLESPRRLGCGFSNPAFDAKVGIEEELQKLGVPHTSVNVAWYLNNMETFEKPKKKGDVYELEFPIGPDAMHAIHNEDVGECFAQVFDHPEEFMGKKIGLAGMIIKDPHKEIADVFSEVFAPLKFVHQNDLKLYEEHTNARGYGDATLRMYQLYIFRKGADCDVALTHRLNPNCTKTVKEYLINNKSKYKFE